MSRLSSRAFVAAIVSLDAARTVLRPATKPMSSVDMALRKVSRVSVSWPRWQDICPSRWHEPEYEVPDNLAPVRIACLQGRDTSNKPLEWTGHHQLSATPPQASCLPLRGSVRCLSYRKDMVLKTPKLIESNWIDFEEYPVVGLFHYIINNIAHDT